jgi:hypothetical protein
LVAKFDPIHPRLLSYRSHYRLYLFLIITIILSLFGFWVYRLSQHPWQEVIQRPSDFIFSLAVLVALGIFYFGWLSSKLYKSVQVFQDKIVFHMGRSFEEALFVDVESVNIVCWSLFYFKMKNGYKHYFSASLERVDYVWEGIKQSRPDLIEDNSYEDFRLKLVQYDHHQKRKEWFFRHKLVDVLNWIVLPLAFMGIAYLIQSQSVMIYRPGFYFFRIFMYSMLIMLMTTFFYSLIFKKFVFDKMVELQKGGSAEKLRDLEFEGMVLQRSKLLQMVTASFIFVLVLKSDANFYSVARLKDDLQHLQVKKGHPILVDNRFNCFDCKYPLRDGDYIVFGKGSIGQLMARGGESVGEVSQDQRGRMIASHQVVEVPAEHVAIKAGNGQAMLFVRIDDIIGKLQK